VKQVSTVIQETSTTTFKVIGGCEEGDTVEAVGNTEMASADSAAVIATQAAAAALVSQNAAAVSETNADNSADAAAISAGSASVSASSAATSASNASTSETNAAASYDAFDDRYLGSKSSAPSVDNDGNTLLTGALYWNSTESRMYVWSGSAWKAVISNPTPQTLTDGATVNWDWSNGNAKLSIAANRTLANPTGQVDGQYCTLRVGRSGAFTINSFGAKFKGVASIIQSNVSGYIDHFVFRYDSTSDTFELVGFRAHIGA
jgi:hypothetical protein